MTSVSLLSDGAIIEDYAWHQYSSIIDIGIAALLVKPSSDSDGYVWKLLQVVVMVVS
jgi:hypothetical protein